MENKDKIVSVDFQGWPEYKKTFKEILIDLGAIDDGDCLKFKKDDPILNMYPQRLRDDGMAYGIDPEWIVEVDTDRKEIFNIFTQASWDKERLESWINDQEECERLMKAKWNI